MWWDQVVNVQENASRGRIGVQEWGRTKPFCEQECPNLYWTRALFDRFFFPVDKVRPVFLLGTENHWPVCVYDATLSIPPENTQDMMLWWGLLVPHTCQGHSGDPFAPARESIHISEKLKHVWHLRQSQTCCFGYTAVPLQEWVTVILQCRFSIRLNQFAQAARRQSQTLFQNLPVLPAPFCTNTSICLAKTSL